MIGARGGAKPERGAQPRFSWHANGGAELPPHIRRHSRLLRRFLRACLLFEALSLNYTFVQYTSPLNTNNQYVDVRPLITFTSNVPLTYLFRICSTAILIILILATNSQAGVPSDDAQALLNEARASSSKGLRDDAIKLYRRVAKLLPNELSVRKELASLLASQVATRLDAEKVYAEAASLAPNDASLALERASNLDTLGDNVNAALEYRRAFELGPNSEEALHGYVLQITRLGSAPVAIARASSKLAAEPKDVPSRVILAELFFSEGRYIEASGQFALAKKVAPDNLVVLRGLAESSLALGYYELATEFFQLASKHVERGRFLADLGRVYLASGQFETALRLLQSNTQDIDRDASGLILLADCYRAIGLPELERMTLTRAKEIFPSKNAQALERLARISFELHDKNASLAACREILTFDPQNPVARFGLELNGEPLTQQAPEGNGNTQSRTFARNLADGEAAVFWNQPKVALVNLRKAVAVRQDSQRLSMAFGVALLKNGDAQEARTAFAQIAIGYGNRPDALLGMADAEMLARTPKQAFVTYAKVLEVDQANFRALAGEAEALYQTGKIEGAAVLLNNLHRRSPDTVVIRERLLAALSFLGRSFNLQEQPATASLIAPTLRAGDKVEIKVAGRSSLNVESQLDDDGLLQIPTLSKRIHAGGLTENELSSIIANQARARLAGTTVLAAITSLQAASLRVSGAVYLPGRFNIRRGFRLNEALMLAGGANARAARIIYVVRGDDSSKAGTPGKTLDRLETYERIEIEKGSVSLSRPLQAGDAVIVPEKDSAFIVGEVARPGAITISGKMGLLEALEQKGGLLADARSDNLQLSRSMPGRVALQQFIINLEDIKQHRTGDVILRPGDILEVTSRYKETVISLASQMSNSTAVNEPVVAIKGEPPVKPAPEPLVNPVSARVLNGKAIDLPSPEYPELARRRRATGIVVVEVTIDVDGKVLSAKALRGNSALLDAAVQAALRARFSPTTLSGQPVKVAAVIKYKFALAQ